VGYDFIHRTGRKMESDHFCSFCQEHLAQPRRTAAWEVCAQTIPCPHRTAFDRSRGRQSRQPRRNLPGELLQGSRFRVSFAQMEFWRGTGLWKFKLHCQPISKQIDCHDNMNRTLFPTYSHCAISVRHPPARLHRTACGSGCTWRPSEWTIRKYIPG